jgi:hypothetical protein
MMGANDPRRQVGARDRRGRMDGPPGWADQLLVGRSNADKEADQDLMLRLGLLLLAIVMLLLTGLNALFTTLGLQFGWWSAPVFVPLCVWVLVSACMNRVLRPVELEWLKWRQRLAGAGALLLVLWVVWPLWAGPAAAAWKTGHGGFGSLGPRYPLGMVLGASPVAMGLVAFLLLAVGMLLAPRVHKRQRQQHQAPPGGPERLRAPLVSEQRDRPRHPRWP